MAFFSYLVDPLWCYSHSNRFNLKQEPIDDRQLKTNYLAFGNRAYDTLIIGNSRVEMMDQNDFGTNAFNYATGGMAPKEYGEYISYAAKVNGRPFARIIMGMSFVHSNEKLNYITGNPPSHYFDTSNKPFYRYVSLFGADVFRHAWSNAKHSHERKTNMYFDRGNVFRVQRENLNYDKLMPPRLKEARDSYRDYEYLTELKQILRDIRKANPDSRISIFTPPVAKPLFCAMVEEGRLDDYERWLRDLVAVSREVHHFEYLNSVTRESGTNFFDGSHYYPEIGKVMAHFIMGIPDVERAPDFGILLDNTNIDAQLEVIRKSATECTSSQGV